MENYEFTNHRKGENGTVLVIGGSELYTGAPYFAALSALRSGCDLAYIFTNSTSINSLKVLLPEAVVLGISCEEWILDRIDVCIFGCGLGRQSEDVLNVIEEILHYLTDRNVFIIADGDGLYYFEYLCLNMFPNIIFTPNYNEIKYIEALHPSQFVIQKGECDVIKTHDSSLSLKYPVCQKRCGGQGDILCGIIATLLCKMKNEVSEINVKRVLRHSCIILRRSAIAAYEKHKMSLITRDIFEFLFDSLLLVLNYEND